MATLLFIPNDVVMAVLEMKDIEVCTFCREAYQRWSKNSNFNKLKKEKVQVCFLCKEAMCSDCVQDSQSELE